MRPKSGLLYPAALAVCLATALGARADMIQWSYNWEPSVMNLTSGTGGGHMALSDEPIGHAAGSSDIVATNLHDFSSASVGSPDSFANKAYTLKLTLTDAASGKSGSLSFSGLFTGTFSANHSSIRNTFTGQLSESITLGNNLYTVTIGPYSPPGPPTAVNAGSIAAHVDVKAGSTGGTGGNGTPEPSTLLLAGLGMSLAGLNGWRKRRPAAAA